MVWLPLSYPAFLSLSVLLYPMGILRVSLPVVGTVAVTYIKVLSILPGVLQGLNKLALVSSPFPLFSAPLTPHPPCLRLPGIIIFIFQDINPNSWVEGFNQDLGCIGSDFRIFCFLILRSLSLGGLGKLRELDYLFSSFMLPILSRPHLNHVIGKSNWKGSLILPCVASLHTLFRSVTDLSASLDEVQSQ